MKKPSHVIALALLKTYGLGGKRAVFMCNAIERLHARGHINQHEAERARATVMKFVRSYNKTSSTLRGALEERGIIEKNITRLERMKVTRRLYIKHAIKLFFNGM